MFRSKPSGVGIALHACALEIVHVPEGRPEALEDVQVARVPLRPEQYDNGRVKQAELFAAQVRQVFLQLGLPRHHVTLALPSAVTVIRPMMVPNMKKTKLRPVIQFQIGKAIALPFSNAVFDFEFLPGSLEMVRERLFHGDKSQPVPVLLVAAAGELIQGLKTAFELAEVELSVIEVKGISILRALRAMAPLPSGPLILLEFGVDRVEAHFYQAGALLFTRTLELSPEKYGSGMGDWTLLEEQDMANHLERMLADLSLQVERLLSFFQHTLRSDSVADIGELWVSGIVPAPERLQAFLHRQLDGLDIRHVPCPVLVRTPDGAGESGKCSLAAVGAALQGGVDDADQFAP